VAGDVAGLVGQEPHYGVGDLVRLADPPHRDEGGVAVRVAARPLCSLTADLYGDLEMEDVAEEVWDLPALFGPTESPTNCHSPGS
jgi:hypothetical protein